MTATRTTTTTAGRELVLELASKHAPSMLAVARRYSLCADDAHDACQRGLEILLRHADSLEPRGAPAWLRTVVKHEALAIRAARRRIVGPMEVDLDATEARDIEPADDRAAAAEQMGHSTEALSRLKPQEVRALVLKAQGYSYREIADITSWTYTKVNRCITEGRRAFLDRYAEIEAGRECERWAPALSALADGEASAQDVTALRPHLRHCPSCRATLRAFRTAPAAVAAVAGPAAWAAGSPALDVPDGDGENDVPGLLARAWDALAGGVHERVLLSSHKLSAGLEAVSSGKVAVVAASATALAGGGAAALHGEAAPSSPVRALAARPATSRSAPTRTSPRDAVASPPATAPARSALLPAAVGTTESRRAEPGAGAPPESEFAPAGEEQRTAEPAPASPATSAGPPAAEAAGAHPAEGPSPTEFGP